MRVDPEPFIHRDQRFEAKAAHRHRFMIVWNYPPLCSPGAAQILPGAESFRLPQPSSCNTDPEAKRTARTQTNPGPFRNSLARGSIRFDPFIIFLNRSVSRNTKAARLGSEIIKKKLGPNTLAARIGVCCTFSLILSDSRTFAPEANNFRDRRLPRSRSERSFRLL